MEPFKCLLAPGRKYLYFRVAPVFVVAVSLRTPRVLRRKPVEYKETIEPTTIARRLMDIREQMAEQLGADLRQMASENARLYLDYVDEVRIAVT